ncbi:MAG: hypothetical protein ACRDTM_06035 [Micromonosporaceae bacterium]
MRNPCCAGAVRRALALGGDRAVARSVVAAHRRMRWTRRYQACRDPWPCRGRREADEVQAR